VKNSLTVRSDLPGEVMDRRVRRSGSPEDVQARRHIILIHGFHNSEDRAQKAYAVFLDQMRQVTPVGRLGAIWPFYWPGNHSNRLVSIASYSARVSDATEAGRLLAEYLAGLRHRPEVCLIAHSLGCRVALETVARIKEVGGDYHGARITQVCLLAAAVPVVRCRSPYAFAAALPKSREHIFHSRRDLALRFGFRPGQGIYGEPGPAVGRDGLPAKRWTTTTNTQLRHSQYWGSRDVAREIAEHLGLATARRLASRIIGAEPIADQHWTVNDRTLPSRLPPSRRID
jgi:pimeloyl-ACP methyl ester carboxylesterase